MLNPAEIEAVSITLEVAGRQCLFIVLDRDGSINRAGTGTLDNEENDLFIGAGQANLFKQLKYGVGEDLIGAAGVYKDPQPEGQACKLLILLKGPAEVVGLIFEYGSESEGPPEEVTDLVRAAIDLTDPWYEGQKQMTRSH